MREIKFRAWYKTEKDIGGQRMMDWEELDVMDEDGVIPFMDVLTGIEKNLIPMQFTGLHDKNGTEIYEGDILEIENETNAQVLFGDGMFVGKEINGWDPMADYFPLGGNVKTAKVIGNIYENPELLPENMESPAR